MSDISNNPTVPSKKLGKIKLPRWVSNLGVIPTSYKDSMDFYETISWLCKYLEETVIPAVNQNGQAVYELQQLYVNLRDYVEHYFDNLDIQEEINNKLDDMTESGELAEIINQQIFDELNAKLNLLTNERILCISDSYGVGTTSGGTIEGWCDRLKTLRNLSNANYIKLVEGSSGFTREGLSGHTFQSLLEANINSITNPETITHVIVGGGHNEYESTGQDLNSAINSFVTYCKTNFPNAKIYVGMIGNDSRSNSTGKTVRNALYNFIIRSYQNSVRYGAIYLSGIENIMHEYYDFMSDDGIHPNSLGYNFLASYISNCIDGSYADFTGNNHQETFTANNSESTFTIKSRIVNDNISFSFDTITIHYGTAFTWNGGAQLLLSATNPTNFAYHDKDIKIPVYYYCVSTGNVFHGGVGFLEFKEGGINIRNALIGESGYIAIENVTDLVIQPASITVDNGIC